MYYIDLLARSSIRIDIFRELLSIGGCERSHARDKRTRKRPRDCICLSEQRILFPFGSHNSVVQDGDR